MLTDDCQRHRPVNYGRLRNVQPIMEPNCLDLTFREFIRGECSLAVIARWYSNSGQRRLRSHCPLGAKSGHSV
jgi:hypothetical protein